MCFETKGTDTDDLFARQHRSKKEHETPIKQAWSYMGAINLDYGICTNYKYFVLITKQYGYSKYHLFDFRSIKNNEEKLREFVGIFSKKRIVDEGFVEKVQKESIDEEQKFTKEFYKLYHETRLMMIKSFEEKDNVSTSEAYYFTQLFLNRLVFIFFVDDRGYIPDRHILTKRILNVLESNQCNEHSKKIYEDIRELFVIFDKGSKQLDVFGFNGGLFNGIMPDRISFSDFKDKEFFLEVRQYSELAERTRLNEKSSEIINKYESLNPIISNLLLMDSFDFNTEVNVNILGHIFEQSISDLEELKKEGVVSKRKKDGVYYTPEHITDYICRNSIIPYLSKSNVSTVSELINEHENELEEFERKFREIKILDPACGSGAFLIKAIDILLEIHKEIQNSKTDIQHVSTQSQITQEWDEDKEIRAIIENNIYGVDINRESIEITKLSLFLKLASNERKLIGLSKNILQGNSLIDNSKVTPNAFLWEKEFPEILGSLIENKGFDIVVGNPPYFNLGSNDILKNSPDCEILSDGVLNVASLFIKKGMDLLKGDGCLGFIIPKSFLVRNSWKRTRNLVLAYSLMAVNDVGKQWEEVGLEQTVIFVIKNNRQIKTKILSKFKEVNKIPQAFFKDNGSILTGLDDEKLSLVIKIEENSVRLGNISDMFRGITVNSSQYFSERKNNLVHVLGGTNVERFLIKDGNKRKPNRFLNSDDDRIKKDYFKHKRIINQRVASSIPRIISTIEDKKLPTDDTLNNIILHDENYSYEDVTAILNSELMTFYLRFVIINDSTLTIDLDRPYMGKIPIKNPKGLFLKPIQSILENKKILDECRKKFFNRIQEQFPNVSISKKLGLYHDMDFSEFVRELERLKARIPLKQKDEWEDYFNDHRMSAWNLSDQIKKDEERINQMVFELYGLSDDEARAIRSML